MFIRLFVQVAMVLGDTFVPHKASVIFSTRRTEISVRYISIRASSTEDSLRRYLSMIAVSKEPLWVYFPFFSSFVLCNISFTNI